MENITAHNTSGEIQEVVKTKDVDISLIINLVYRPVVVLLGSVGNILSFLTMTRGSLKKLSTCFYLSVLAIAGKYTQRKKI